MIYDNKGYAVQADSVRLHTIEGGQGGSDPGEHLSWCIHRVYVRVDEILKRGPEE